MAWISSLPLKSFAGFCLVVSYGFYPIIGARFTHDSRGSHLYGRYTKR